MATLSPPPTPVAYESIPESLRTEDMLASSQWMAYTRARDNGHTKFCTDAKKFERFYIGEQWDDKVALALDAEFRPHHSINLVLSTINAILGEYIAQRQEIVFKAKGKGASEGTADALTKMAKHISDDSHSRWVEKSVVADALIMDRGFFDLRLDQAENITGEIRESDLDPIDVLIDPGARSYDPRTWSEVFTTRWMTPDQIAIMYGAQYSDKLRYVSSTESGEYGIDAVDMGPETFSQDKNYYTSGPNANGQAYGYGEDWRRVKRLRVVERQYYIMTQRPYFVDVATGDKSPVPDSWPKEKVEAVRAAAGLQIVPQMERRVRWTVTVCKYVLKDGWSPYRRFTIIPFFPYFRRGRPFGAVRNLIDPQELLNKTSSQTLHVVNTTANSGWIIEAGSLVNMTADELRKVGAKTGLVIEYNRNSTAPTKILPNQVPSGLERIAGNAVMYFRNISGVSDAILGQPGSEISGDALAIKERRGLTQLDTVFDNLAYTRQLRAEMLLEIIQDFYTEERILKVIVTDDYGEEHDQDLILNAQAASGEILNDVTVGEYRVLISSRTARDSADDTAFNQMLTMREAGIMVPDWAIMEASSLDRKREIAQWMRQTQGAAEPTQQEIEMQQMQQELELRRQMAEIGELEARVQERLANAAMLQAKAQSLSTEQQSELLALGAKMRAEAERDMLEFQKSREDLQARLLLMQQKTAAQKQTAMLQALTKRLDTEAKERIAVLNAHSRTQSAQNYGKSFNKGGK